ncbi:AAEL010854-PA [Aedes aegypti]|uniref:Ubiquitin carboxyl-terminal hydrolase n=1 Tax=Aedes aegypti TaxID=7159 RepID=Q16RT1_AEDAE|nr:AAEL010854-PA [Aedes aegypti]
MPVISAYSTSGSSYISPSYRYKSSLTDRKSYTTSSSLSSSLYRRSSYRYDLPSSSSIYSSSYRTTSSAADRTADADLSSTLASVNVSSNGDSGVSITVNGKDNISTSRPSRYSTAYSYSSSLSSAPLRDYSSRLSSRSSDTRFKDRDNNCPCVGGTSSSSYVSNLRNTALSGAELYQKYSVSTYKPNSFERIIPSRSPSETPKPSSILKSTSPTNPVTQARLRKAVPGPTAPIRSTLSKLRPQRPPLPKSALNGSSGDITPCTGSRKELLGLSSYRNHNFLKHECELVKRELSKSATEIAFKKGSPSTGKPIGHGSSGNLLLEAPAKLDVTKVKQFLPPVSKATTSSETTKHGHQPKDHEDDDKNHHHNHIQQHKPHENSNNNNQSTGISPSSPSAAQSGVELLKPIDRPTTATTILDCTQKNDTSLFKPSSSSTTCTTSTTTTPSTTTTTESLTTASSRSSSTCTVNRTYTNTNSRSGDTMKSLHITSEIDEPITHATIKLRPALNGTSNGGSRILATASATTDDLLDGDYHLRAGTASKSIHSTSPVGYRSRDYDSGISSYRSGLGSSSLSSSSALKSIYDRTNDDSHETTRTGSSRKEGLCGLWNIGNTCFMNSIIQCLSHTRELTNFLRQQSTTERGTSKDHKILAEYTKLIKDMWSGTTRSVNPSELKYAFSSKHRMYSGSAQQDAQEFLRFFIDSLHCALNESVKREPINRAIEDDDMDNRVKATMMWDWYSRVENSMIKNLFVGLLRSTLKCTYCNGASVTFDPFWDLSLPLPSTNSRCKLENCMDMFVKEEVMDGIDQPTCSRCKARRKCTKSLTIERFPKYLVIHLKRFSETRWSNKLTNVVEFPTGERELNLQPYASEDHSGPVNYSLYGISNHMGSTAGGHYVAVCKHPVTKEWNEFNDNFVSETSERSLVTSSAYVLFYERA